MNKTIILFLVFVIAAVLIAGCTTPQPVPQPVPVTTLPQMVIVTTSPPPSVPTQLAGTWVVTKMGVQGGTAVITPESTGITLTFFADGTVAGNGGCNNYNGPFILGSGTTPKGKALSIGPLVSTRMFCQAYSDQETMYLNILQKAMAYNVDGNQLSITATTGDVLMYQTPVSLVTPKQYRPEG